MEHKDKEIDFLAIGDIVTDAFIELQDAEVHCNIDNENCMLSMRFGDKIPYKDVVVVAAVGNSPNAAVSAHRLGLQSAIMTHVGNDDFGRECIDELNKRGVSTEFVTVEEGKKTNYHYVLSFNAERTILIKHEDFTYNLHKQLKGLVPKWIYFSSVGEQALEYHHEVARWVKENNIKMAFQPGTYQISLGAEKLKDVYESSEIFFCNVEEAQKILETDSRDLKELLLKMHKLGPKIISITDGPDGAYAYDSYNDEYWFHPIYPDPQTPIERTGAGDSFSSTFTVAITLGKSVAEALSWGPINSMNVVQHIGAQAGLQTREQLEEFLKNAPEHYRAQKL
ncbi:MAG: PfkB family carbohydrate kinase [Candidatus Pacebacteria bacterium]|nr:PfkB family carbohydrate kinase [Candidatus Paceibacterota bacterium]